MILTYTEKILEEYPQMKEKTNILYSPTFRSDGRDNTEEVIEENEEVGEVYIINEVELPIKLGDRASSLYVLQAMMLALSYELDNLDFVEITGVYDAGTKRAAEKIMILSGKWFVLCTNIAYIFVG